MQYGVCGGAEIVTTAAEAGYDFFECSVAAALKPSEDEAASREALRQLKAAPLPCKAANGFVPSDLKITGPEADLAALERFTTSVCQRAEQAGIEVVVFGSGGARQIPDGFDRGKAREQIVAFCRMLGPIAQQHGVTIAVEPLNREECNVLNTVAQAGDLVQDVNHPAVRLLVDSYHWAKDSDSAEDIVANGPLFAHVHVATVPNRLPPGAEECDLASFFTALKRAGYRGRISVEAQIPNPPAQLPQALSTMKAFCE